MGIINQVKFGFLFSLFMTTASLLSASEEHLNDEFRLTVQWPSDAQICEPNAQSLKDNHLSRLYMKIKRGDSENYPERYLIHARQLKAGDTVRIERNNTTGKDELISNYRVLHLDSLSSISEAKNIAVNYRDVSETTNTYLLRKSATFRIDNHVLYEFGGINKTFRVLNCNPPAVDDDGFTDLSQGCNNFNEPACVGFYVEPMREEIINPTP